MDTLIKVSSLNDVKPFKTSWRVQVKVLHTWVSFSHQSGATLQMVLTDENGVKIHSSCKQSLLKRFEKQCVVGTWKVITNFTLKTAMGLNRPTKHVFKMEFMEETSVEDCKITCENMFLELQDFANVIYGSRDEHFLIDVVGEVLDYGGLEMVQLARKEVLNIAFTLRDINNQRLPCCIFGNLAQMLSQEGKQPNNEDICLIRFAKIGIYKGDLQISNTFDSSFVLIVDEDGKPQKQTRNVVFKEIFENL